MLYVFGYGSLIYPDGINGRGMQHVYTEDDLRPVRLYGYQRCWNAAYGDLLFLGCRHEKDATMNGVIFPVDQSDFPAFTSSEMSSPSCRYPLYTFVNVTNRVSVILSTDDIILCCVTKSPAVQGTIRPYYLRYIADGLEHRGSEFTKEFCRTTEAPPEWSGKEAQNFWQSFGFSVRST